MAIVKWSDHALDRMREQTRFIAEQSCSSEVAWNWANDIFAEAEGLADFPDMGHRLPEFSDAPYLEILVRKNFRLIYRHINDICYIVTVRRCSMLLDETSLAEIAVYNRVKADIEKARKSMSESAFMTYWEKRNDELRNLGIKTVGLEQD